MGYESKIYITEKAATSYRDDGMVFGAILAMVDMRKCYPLSDNLRRMPATNCYIYAEDGDDPTIEDRYGDKLTECTIGEAITFVEKAMEKSDYDYWRYHILLATLREFERTFGGDSDAVVVLHYGY